MEDAVLTTGYDLDRHMWVITKVAAADVDRLLRIGESPLEN